ncbi:hypothetical protein P5673_021361 [Acropora cervicornis]|uniref:Uncharacterized protein n=1 Tax=Acropora cervicornis TaxID=6130 RepID=A0AAD9V0A0_ACRCE|nr:hypothetical protein P5673_021361 [Acropora cervicornis]
MRSWKNKFACKAKRSDIRFGEGDCTLMVSLWKMVAALFKLMNYKLTFTVLIRVFHHATENVGETQINKLYLSSTIIANLNMLGLEIGKEVNSANPFTAGRLSWALCTCDMADISGSHLYTPKTPPSKSF